MVERTLLNIKPDAVARNLVGEIIHRIEDAGYRIVALDKIQLTQKEAETFYAVHSERPFFKSLVTYMNSGPCVPIVVEGENAIQGIRSLIGATNPEEAAKGTIRADYAESIERNCVHASDGQETAVNEIAFFFSQRQLLD